MININIKNFNVIKRYSKNLCKITIHLLYCTMSFKKLLYFDEFLIYIKIKFQYFIIRNSSTK